METSIINNGMLPTTTPTESDPLKCHTLPLVLKTDTKKLLQESWKESSPGTVTLGTVKEVYEIRNSLFSPSIGTGFLLIS